MMVPAWAPGERLARAWKADVDYIETGAVEGSGELANVPHLVLGGG